MVEVTVTSHPLRVSKGQFLGILCIVSRFSSKRMLFTVFWDHGTILDLNVCLGVNIKRKNY